MRYWVLALLLGCGHVCSGVLVAPDVVITAEHCVDGITTTEAKLPRGFVRVGDELTLEGAGCTGAMQRRVGTVLEIAENQALLSTVACPGDSGGAVRDRTGQLVGTIVAYRVPDWAAIVQLF